MLDKAVIAFFDVFGKEPFSHKGGFNPYADLDHRQLSSTEGGILNGVHPLADALNLFLVQATIIIALCGALSWAGKMVKQPKVIFEIVAGIILGPSAIGHNNPKYMNKIFPNTTHYNSLTTIYVIANMGLVLYLFLIGIEMDFKMLRVYAKRCGGISFCGICLPFLLGLAVGTKMFNVLQSNDPVYGEQITFNNDSLMSYVVFNIAGGVSHIAFMVFIATAMSITAFPVLARILKEGGLIYTKPGSMSMAAAALDDAMAWCLLALSIAIADGHNKSVGGQVFASVLAFVIGMIVLVRPIWGKIVLYLEAKNHAFYDANLFSFTICILFMCAWTTAVLGIHAIFGAFIFGICIPRESRLIHNCVKHIEVLIVTICMPLYFVYSGLKTDVTTIRGSAEWGMCALIIFLAVSGKVFGCGLSALATGMTYREAGVVAILMNTRGLVELIVLNVGLTAGSLSTRTFSVMVIMCLFTTFITQPIVELIYPKKLRSVAVKQLGEEGEKDKEHGDNDSDDIPVPVETKEGLINFLDGKSGFRMGIVLTSLENFQHVMDAMTCLLPVSSVSSSANRSVSVTAMRFIEQTDTIKDNFISLNEEGRLIKVDEESPEVVVPDPTNPTQVPQSPLLPLGMFCRALGTPVSLLRIEGNADEYPVELGKVSDNNELSFLMFNWKPKDLFFQKIYWSAVHGSGNLLGLLVPQRGLSAAAASINTVAPNESAKFNPATLLPNVIRRMTIDQANASVIQAAINNAGRKVVNKRIGSVAAVFSNSSSDKYMFRLLELYILNGMSVTVVYPGDWESADSKDLLTAARAFYTAFGSNATSTVNVIVATGTNHDSYAALIGRLSDTAFDLLLVSYITPEILGSNHSQHNSQHAASSHDIEEGGAPATPQPLRIRSGSVTGKMLEMIEFNSRNEGEGQTLDTSHDPELGVLATIARDYPYVAEADMLVLRAAKNINRKRRSSFVTAGESTL
jgi:Kef-type K+ transport system membrane component KefB